MVFFPHELIIKIYEFLNLQDLQIIKFVNQFITSIKHRKIRSSQSVKYSFFMQLF